MTIITVYVHVQASQLQISDYNIQYLRVIPGRKPDKLDLKVEAQQKIVDLAHNSVYSHNMAQSRVPGLQVQTLMYMFS
jgi:hypothetical protein